MYDSRISRTEEATAEAFSSLSLTFDEIPEVEEYDVKLYNASNGALKGEFTFPENKVVIEELEPQTSYLVKVRGKQNFILQYALYTSSQIAGY